MCVKFRPHDDGWLSAEMTRVKATVKRVITYHLGEEKKIKLKS
jgi:hypothetical protein